MTESTRFRNGTAVVDKVATFADYVVAIMMTKPDTQRYGQWAFNLLHELRPELADEVRATEVDPFYDNLRVPEFLDWLEGKW